MGLVSSYYRLTKPGIVYGNLLHVIAGVLLALPAVNAWQAALSVTAGTSLVIASACVVNNMIDRPYDARMERTKARPSVNGAIAPRSAMLFAGLLATVGFGILAIGTNFLTVVIGVIAYLAYTIIYTYSKRVTVHSTLIGTIPGALPAMAGYTALTVQLDLTAWMIFGLIAVWQLPHFYAIAVFRRKDYAAAGWPVLSTRIDERSMRKVIVITVALYWLFAAVFAILLLWLPSALMIIGGASYWLYRTWRSADSHIRWARSVFGVSLLLSIVLVAATFVDFALKHYMQ